MPARSPIVSSAVNFSIWIGIVVFLIELVTDEIQRFVG
jgi:hypothetical protein